MSSVKIGILALQGGFEAHAKSLTKLGITAVYIKKPETLDEVSGLIIPGGESTTILKLLTPEFKSKLIDFYKSKKAIFGTCAGTILLAETVEPEQFSFGFINIAVKRNAYGTQLDSFIATAQCMSCFKLDDLNYEDIELQHDNNFKMVFIRAPKITYFGPEIEVLMKHDSTPVLVRHGNILCATFHPELTEDLRIHKYFLNMI